MITKRSLDCNIKSEDKVKEYMVSITAKISIITSNSKKDGASFPKPRPFKIYWPKAKLQVFSEDFDFRIVVHLVGGVATAIEADVAALYTIDGERTALVVFHVFLFLACAKLG